MTDYTSQMPIPRFAVFKPVIFAEPKPNASSEKDGIQVIKHSFDLERQN